MFDIGFSEMIMLAAIALVAIGPKQLPEVARTVGRMINEFKRASGDFTRTLVDARESTNQIVSEARKNIFEPQIEPQIEPQKEAAAQTTEASQSRAQENQMSFELDEVPSGQRKDS
jgi:sec-independent protein translocase protein TatB